MSQAALRYMRTLQKSQRRIPGLGFPISPTNWCKASPFQRSEFPQHCLEQLKRAGWGEVRVSEIKCKKRSKRK